MKKFIVIGNQNACIYKEFFPYMKTGEVCTGYNHIKEFKRPDNTIQKFGNICWFSNLYIYKENDLVLSKTYDEKEYQRYDNYDAINTDKIKDIPYDYDGAIGVPITILDKVSTGGIIHLNQEVYDIIDVNPHFFCSPELNIDQLHIKGRKDPYARVLIQKADYSIEGMWNDLRDPDNQYIKGKPLYLDDKHPKFQGPVIDGKAKYPRVIIQKKRADYMIVKYRKGDDEKDLTANGEYKYARVIIKKK